MEDRVLYWFRELSRIPRVSGNEQRVSDWLVAQAKAMGLVAEQDEALNVIIRKGEGNPVILQGHMDMVGEKEADSPHDFHTDPIRLVEKDGMLYADRTTLGADNGAAVALALSLLEEDDPALPAFEVLVTSGEEIGLLGANALAPGKLKGKMMLNLDAETEGEFLVSCAGGQTVLLDLPLAREEGKQTCLEVSLKGFRGGHSGIEIDKGRLNAIKELGQWLKRHNARLAGLEAPGKFNAISRRATALVTAESADTLIKDQQNQQALWRETEPEAQLVIREAGSMKPLSPEASEALIALINGLPNGIHTLSPDLPGLVESSSNLGVITQEEDQLSLSISIRSSAPDKMNEIEQAVRDLAGKAGATVRVQGAYPGWAYEKISPLRDSAVRVWERMFGRAPQLNAIHAGLECGVIKSKYPEVQMLSMGPNMYKVHTPQEHLDLASMGRMAQYIKELLKELKR